MSAETLSPTMVTAVLGGLAAVLGGLATMIRQIAIARRLAHEAVEVAKTTSRQVTQHQRTLETHAKEEEKELQVNSAKLDNITFLVDGTKTELLQRIAVLEAVQAYHTGLPEHAARAESARLAAEEQLARVAVIIKKGSH